MPKFDVIMMPTTPWREDLDNALTALSEKWPMVKPGDFIRIRLIHDADDASTRSVAILGFLASKDLIDLLLIDVSGLPKRMISSPGEFRLAPEGSVYAAPTAFLESSIFPGQVVPVQLSGDAVTIAQLLLGATKKWI